jgi:hypothetical protein
MTGTKMVVSIWPSISIPVCIFSLLAGPHPRSLSLGGALRALHSVASLGPQARFLTFSAFRARRKLIEPSRRF